MLKIQKSIDESLEYEKYLNNLDKKQFKELKKWLFKDKYNNFRYRLGLRDRGTGLMGIGFGVSKEDYLKLTRSQYGIDSFDELLDFAKKCKAYVPHVVLTIVDTTIPEKDVEICKQIAQNIGVTLRIRPFED